MVNIGLIGLGGIGTYHFYNSMRLKNARLIAVADISKKSRNLAKAERVKEVYEDYEKLLENPDIDCVIISLPNYLHAECAIMAAEHGKHVLIEKPLARNVKEGKEIVSKTRKAGVKTMVGYPLRFSKFTKIKKEIDKGYLGNVVTAITTFVSSGPFFQRVSNASVPSPVPSWWFQRELVGGGALLDTGSHVINLLLFYFGHDIASVKSSLGHRFNMPFEDHALCFIKFKKGISAIVNAGWCSPERIIKVELYGTAKHVSESIGPPTPLDYAKSVIKRQSINNSPPFHKELQYFVDCVKSDTSPSPSAEEALEDLKVISKAYQHVFKLEPESEQNK